MIRPANFEASANPKRFEAVHTPPDQWDSTTVRVSGCQVTLR
jgi:hypothetical protein